MAIQETSVDQAESTQVPPSGDVPSEGSSKPSLRVSCRLELTDQGRLNAIEKSAEQLLRQVFSPKVDPRPVWDIQEAVWPELGLSEFRHHKPEEITLTLWPLSRIGQMEGKSGSLVLIAYFSTASLKDHHSRPLVVKTLDRAKSQKLGEEHNNALSIKPFAYDRKDDFAIPIFFEADRCGFQILWSICSVSAPVTKETVTGQVVPKIAIDDLRTPLRKGSDDRVSKVVTSTFQLLRNFHLRAGLAFRESVDIKIEYEPYLRNIWTSSGSSWGKNWEGVWGARTDKQVPNSGTAKINPLWILDRVLDMKFELFLGAIHGDLHPGNVILRDEESPAIIDFGWACDRAHIAKDFVLLECNLRFLTLRAELRSEEVQTFSGWIGWKKPIPDGLSRYLKARASLISKLRDKASEVFPVATDWDREYVIPLFIVAMGLLRFAPQLGNQQAAIHFVECAANYLAEQFAL